MHCPWCGFEELEGEYIRLYDETIGITRLEKISALHCQRCGATEIGPYDLADGKKPTPKELEKGYYQSENLSRVHRRKVRHNPRRRRKRRDEQIRLHSKDESDEQRQVRRAAN